MTQAIERVAATAPTHSTSLAKVTGYDDRLIQLIKATLCPGADAIELATFLYNARRLGLDPMTRQIYFIKYAAGQPGEIVIGINGYRSQAESSGVYAGSDDAEFEYEDVGQPNGAPSKATVSVWKLVNGQRVPFTASARWKEFYPGDGKVGEQYRKRPHNQLAVRAESHALRKGFPQQMDRLEVQPAPSMWVEAAQADNAARDDPEFIARNARRYDEIYGEKEDSPGASAASPTAARVSPQTPVAVSPTPPVSTPAEIKADKYRRNRELVQRAKELGVEGMDPLKLGAADDVVDAANIDLEDRIARVEWEQQEVQRQRAQEGLR